MNYLARKFARTRITLLSALFSSILLSACGGGGGVATSLILSGVGGTGIGVGGTGIVFGAITGFGSVFINGTRYDTSGASFIVDGESLPESALKLGMVVKIEAETEDGEFTGNAFEVVYNNEVQGPVDSAPVDKPGTNGMQKTFVVLGESITIDDTATRFEGTSFADIDANDVVEVSGFRTTAPDTIFATYLKKISVPPAGSEAELRGTITGYTLVPSERFTLNGIVVEVGAATVNVDGGSLQNGLYVEVEGTIQGSAAPFGVLAAAIESADEDFGDEVDDVRLEGIISEYVDDSNFKIDGQLINAGGAEIEPMGAMLTDGLEVEIEGDIVGGTFIAGKVEVEEEESELRAFVAAVPPVTSPNSFTVEFPFTTGMSTTVTVNVDAQTAFEDETGPPPFSLDDLVGGGATDYVIVKGTEVGNEINATLVKRVTADPDERRRLEGIVDDYTAYTGGANGSITVLGIEYGLNGDTQYDPDPNILVGDVVEIEDRDDPPTYSIDGIADKVEIED